MVVYDYDGQISLLTEIKLRVRIRVSLRSTSVYYGREAAHDQNRHVRNQNVLSSKYILELDRLFLMRSERATYTCVRR